MRQLSRASIVFLLYGLFCIALMLAQPYLFPLGGR